MLLTPLNRAHAAVAVPAESMPTNTPDPTPPPVSIAFAVVHTLAALMVAPIGTLPWFSKTNAAWPAGLIARRNALGAFPLKPGRSALALQVFEPAGLVAKSIFDAVAFAECAWNQSATALPSGLTAPVMASRAKSA